LGCYDKEEKPFNRELFFRALADSTRPADYQSLLGIERSAFVFFVEILKTNLRLPAWLSNWVQARNLSASVAYKAVSTLTTTLPEGSGGTVTLCTEAVR
jgi:hypothetical protein